MKPKLNYNERSWAIDVIGYIKTYTNKNEIVLDNCMGSGSTAVASYLENRNFIGFDNGSCKKTKKPFAEIATNRYLKLKEKYKLFEIGV